MSRQCWLECTASFCSLSYTCCGCCCSVCSVTSFCSSADTPAAVASSFRWSSSSTSSLGEKTQQKPYTNLETKMNYCSFPKKTGKAVVLRQCATCNVVMITCIFHAKKTHFKNVKESLIALPWRCLHSSLIWHSMCLTMLVWSVSVSCVPSDRTVSGRLTDAKPAMWFRWVLAWKPKMLT